MPLSPNRSRKPSLVQSVDLRPLKLSRHFTLATLTYSDTARQHGLDNQPNMEHLANLRRLARSLESIQQLLGRPLSINSAYRSPQLNQLVGGVPTSRHALGLAADFVCPDFGDPLAVARTIAASPLRFDQLIHEYGRWVHFGLAPHGARARRELLTICNAQQGYVDGLFPCQSGT